MRQSPEETTTLSEPAYYILLCLAGEPRHGYAIIKEVEALSQGRLRLSTGTLYGVIKRLLDLAGLSQNEPPGMSWQTLASRAKFIGLPRKGARFWRQRSSRWSGGLR